MWSLNIDGLLTEVVFRSGLTVQAYKAVIKIQNNMLKLEYPGTHHYR